jgi:hypothetical protein
MVISRLGMEAGYTPARSSGKLSLAGSVDLAPRLGREIEGLHRARRGTARWL